MSAHTPTPWRISTDEGDNQRYLVGNDGDQVKLLASIKRHRVSSGDRVPRDDEQRENERFIVTACNSHAAMLAALSTAFVCLQADCGAAFRDLHPATWRQMEQAIAQAHGGAS